jgi:hypothetical protein
VPFTGSRRAGASFDPIRLERLTNGQLTEIETWSEQRPGDPLIEALKAPVAGRFGSFLGQSPIRATLTWLLAERCVTITGRRGEASFEEDAAVRLDRIAAGDIVKASIKGRTVYGEVQEITDGVVQFRPLSPAAGWRHASAQQITGHWRKSGRSSAGDEQHPRPPHEQLSLPGIHG